MFSFHDTNDIHGNFQPHDSKIVTINHLPLWEPQAAWSHFGVLDIVMVSLNCQLDRILNYHRDTPLFMSVMNFLDYVIRVGRPMLNVGGAIL